MIITPLFKLRILSLLDLVGTIQVSVMSGAKDSEIIISIFEMEFFAELAALSAPAALRKGKTDHSAVIVRQFLRPKEIFGRGIMNRWIQGPGLLDRDLRPTCTTCIEIPGWPSSSNAFSLGP